MTTTPLLLHAAPDAAPDLFHAVPIGIGDPFTYLEAGDRRVAVVSVLEADRVGALGIEVLDPDALGRGELLAAGWSQQAVEGELALRVCRELDVALALVPADFPVAVADHVRGGGVALEVDADVFAARRRVKAGGQLDGIRRAQAAADAAMGVARALVLEAGAGLTAEAVREAMQEVTAARRCDLGDDVIVAVGGQGALGHESGSGPIVPGDGVIVDIWPRDRRSRCWADMTRTFVAGGVAPSEELASYHALAAESFERVLDAVRPGVAGGELWRISCGPFEAAGLPTLGTAPPGAPLAEGYFHSLGHGIGLAVHERPHMGRLSDDLVEGDVIAVEPGCYRPGFGGARIESLVRVGADGPELLTAFPTSLA